MTVVTDYTLDTTAKTITLGTDYTDIKLEEIDRIFNLTKGIEIYNSRTPRKHIALKNQAGMDISLTNGVISYIEDAGMDNTDLIQIIIGWIVLDGGTP